MLIVNNTQKETDHNRFRHTETYVVFCIALSLDFWYNISISIMKEKGINDY